MLWVVMVLGFVSARAAAMSCDEARLKCFHRIGCMNALQGYVMGCSTALYESPVNHCPHVCQNALIALMSSDEGKDFMTCECTDDVCHETKQRVEACRPHVMRAVKNDSVVTCEAAQWICEADATCSTALQYYHDYCRSMFQGRRCSFKCKNSIAILKKQEKAVKLNNCVCSGGEDYDCPKIKSNMAKLCFNQTLVVAPVNTEDNEIKPGSNEKDISLNFLDTGNGCMKFAVHPFAVLLALLSKFIVA